MLSRQMVRLRGAMGMSALLYMLLLNGCEPEFVPKPRGFMHIELEAHGYKPLDLIGCPFNFEMPLSTQIVKESRHADKPCWFNIEYPRHKAKVHFSYSQIDRNLPQLLEDMRTLTNKHISKATGISETPIIEGERHVYGMRFDIAGATAASPIQFFVTDSAHHFLRAALYFNAVPNNDSLAPVIQYISEDIERIIATLEWQK